MKKTIILLILSSLLWLNSLSFSTQEENKNQPNEKPSNILKKNSISYNPAGRRDPFRDLLAGKELKEGSLAEGVNQMSLDDVILIGIVKAKGRLTAIINGPKGFPFYLHTGEKFADGFVLSIKDSEVIFRKTKERGIPLYKPKDIIKEINPEER